MKNAKSIVIAFLSSICAFMNGQDSLPKLKLQLFDVELRAMGMNSDSQLSHEELISLTKNEAFVAESKGYSPTGNSYSDYHDMGDFGLNMSWRIKNSGNKIIKRLRPRLGIYYCKRVFSYSDLGFDHRTTVDTLYYTNPGVPPLYIDSVTGGKLSYQYTTDQVLMEIGCNADIITLRYFNFYAGLVYGQGVSLRNEFRVHKYEYAFVERYPGQLSVESSTLKNYTLKETGPTSFVSRVVIPIGFQHRFINRGNFSPGIFGELRPGFENYKIQGGGSVTKFMVSMAGGIRLSLHRHK